MNAIMVVKSDIFINESLCIMDGFRLVKTNAFGFENGATYLKEFRLAVCIV